LQAQNAGHGGEYNTCLPVKGVYSPYNTKFLDLEAEDEDEEDEDEEDRDDYHDLANFIVAGGCEQDHNAGSSLHAHERRLEAKEDATRAELLAREFDRQARHPGEEAGRYLDPRIAQEFADSRRHWGFQVQVQGVSIFNHTMCLL
jgi:hypothetical protein